MEQSPPPDPEIAGWLTTLGVTSLCQWDVLVFLYQHQTTLLGAVDLARLLGYTSNTIVTALDSLETQELVAGSRVSYGARLYRVRVPPDSRVARRLPDSTPSPPTARAAQSAIVALQRFAQGLADDYDAVKAGLPLPWSTGPVEGHITRLKLLKRQMVRHVTHQGITPTGSQNWKEDSGVICLT